MNDALMPDKPSPKHTKLIMCQKPGCKKMRWIKPQDAWQVKWCRWCKDEDKKAKSKASLEKLRAKVQEKQELAKSIDWPSLKRLAHEAGMRAVIAYRKTPEGRRGSAIIANIRSVARVWP